MILSYFIPPGQFYAEQSYVLGGFMLSLNDIEHGILRANKPVPGIHLFKNRHFKTGDPRAVLSLTEVK